MNCSCKSSNLIISEQKIFKTYFKKNHMPHMEQLIIITSLFNMELEMKKSNLTHRLKIQPKIRLISIMIALFLINQWSRILKGTKKLLNIGLKSFKCRGIAKKISLNLNLTFWGSTSQTTLSNLMNINI